MPINARPEFFKAQSKYMAAKTREEKILALEEMLRTAPSHKGAENLRAEIKTKISKLRKQATVKAGRRITTIPKEGDAQIAILGLTQSGKSLLLRKLTNAKPELAKFPFTTEKPEIGMIDWTGVKIQLIEIPSKFESIHMNIAQCADGIVIVIDPKEDIHEQRMILKDVMKSFRINKPTIEIRSKDNIDVEATKKKIWEMLNFIRVYCKEPGKRPEDKPVVLQPGATVAYVAESVHKDFLKYFKFARVWGSTKYPGEMVGLDYVLKDGDIVEIHIS